MFERSPMVGGLFGSAVCALVILGIMMANQVDKVPAGAYRPPSFANDNNAGVGSTQGSLALVNPDSQTSSTEVMFGSGSNTMSSASLQPASFTTVAPH